MSLKLIFMEDKNAPILHSKNTMAADDLVSQAATTSAAIIVLAYF